MSLRTVNSLYGSAEEIEDNRISGTPAVSYRLKKDNIKRTTLTTNMKTEQQLANLLDTQLNIQSTTPRTSPTPAMKSEVEDKPSGN
jgi:hypothetical protein